MLTRRTRIWILIGLASLCCMVLGYSLGERQGLLIGFLLALGINILVYHYSNEHWIDYFKAHQIEGQDPWKILELTTIMAAKARIPVPKVFLIKSDFPTAFSVGRSVRASAIVLSEGLLRHLNYEEQEAVIASEIAKIHRMETLSIGVVSGISAPFFIFCNLLDGLLTVLSIGRLKNTHLCGHICERLMNLLSRFVISQKNYFDSDQSAALMLKNPEQLARVLWKLQNYATTRKLEIPPNAAPFLIVNPLTNGIRPRYFLVQPTVDSRIEKLIGRFPI